MFEPFEHTADIGLRVVAASWNELLVEAARGLTSLLIENPADIRSTTTESLNLTGSQRDELLFDWLNELLFLFETRRMLFREFHMEAHAEGLNAILQGEMCDRSRHQLAHEVKAVTYHGLRVEQTSAGWLAELILDI